MHINLNSTDMLSSLLKDYTWMILSNKINTSFDAKIQKNLISETTVLKTI